MTYQNLLEAETYKTADMALAGLISLYYPIEAIDKQNPRKAYWLFKRDAQLDELVKSYYRRELKVDPVSYWEQISFIKAQLYSQA